MKQGIVAAVFAALVAAVPALAQAPDYSAAGPYGHAFRVEDIPGATETMSDSRIYYPDSAGAIPGSAVPVPIVVFGHGWQMGINRYYSYAEHLASWGYACCLPTISNPLINPEHDKRARLMCDAARFVSALDTVPGDIFEEKLDRWNWGMAGHSMGGGLALLAADTFRLTDTLRAVVALASPQTDPPTNAGDLDVPKLLLPGSVDNIAPWAGVRAAYWDGAPAPGTFAVIRGANHGYYMDFSYFWENGGTATISREEQQRISRRHLTAYFERYLHDDRSAWNFAHCYGDSIWHHPSMETVEVRLEPTAVGEGLRPQLPALRCAPNPFAGETTLVGAGPVWVYNSAGARVGRCTGHRFGRELEPGVYFLRSDKSEAEPLRVVKLR